MSQRCNNGDHIKAGLGKAMQKMMASRSARAINFYLAESANKSEL